jgi:tight adherence protein C
MSSLLDGVFIALSATSVALLVMGLGKMLQRFWIKWQRMPYLQSGNGQVASIPIDLQNEKRRFPGVIKYLSRLSTPQNGQNDATTQLRFVRAGFRQANAAHIYFAIKSASVLLTVVMVFLLMPLVSPKASTSQWLTMMLSMALVANFLPDLYLHWRTQTRAQRMQDSLPDIIDLLVICTESGLGLDAAIAKVVREMNRSCPELCEEFYIMGLEIRAGAARMLALRHLGARVNLDDLYDLVSMLIQADRFGTSLALSLRVQSDVMRGKRMQRAEEIAAKIPIKMLIPLVLFIFPVLLMVLLGPAVMQMEKIFAT